MKTWNRKRSWVAGSLVLTMVAAGGALAASAAPNLTEHSKSGIAAPGKTKTLIAKCGKDGLATSAGFKGELKFNSTLQSSTEALPVQQTVNGHKAKAGLANVAAPAQVAGYAYCGGPELSVASKKSAVNGSSPSPVTAKCPSGRVAYSGGFKTSLSADQMTGPKGAVALSSYRSSDDKWTTQFLSPTSQSASATTYVYCAKAKAPSARSKTRTIKVPEATTGPVVKTVNVTAKCKSGEVSISGGFRPKKVSPQSGPLTIGSRRSSTQGWTARTAAIGQPGSGSTVKFTTYAYCLKN